MKPSLYFGLVSLCLVACGNPLGDGVTLDPDFHPGSSPTAPAVENLTLNFDFTASSVLNPSIRFSKATGANTTGGTYFDSTGVMRTLTTANFLLRSEEMDHATWTTTNVGVTANQSAGPDRMTAMDLITASGGAGYHHITQTLAGFVAGTTYTFSAFVKPGTSNYAWLADGNEVSWHSTFFNVSTCTAMGATANPAGSVYVASGADLYNGVCRIWMSWTRIGNGSATLIIGPGQATNLGLYTPSGAAESIYAWGAQVEVSSSPGTYAYTQAATSYLPRLDYDPTNCAPTCAPKGLLTESASINKITNSANFGGWTLSQGSVTGASGIALDGTNSATAFAATATNGTDTALTSNAITGAAGANMSCSIFAKPNGSNWVKIDTSDGTGAHGSSAYFNVSTGAIGTQANYGTGTIRYALSRNMGNSWYRISLGNQPTAAGTSFLCKFSVANGDNTTGSTNGNGVLIWGAQGENFVYASTYIPTTGVAITRSQEIADMLDGSWYSAAAGTIYLEAIQYSTRAWGATSFYYVGTGGSYNRLAQEGGWGANNSTRWIPFDGTVQNANHYPNPAIFVPDATFKQAFAFQVNDLIAAGNGTLTTATTTTTNPLMTGFTSFSIGRAGGSGYGGWIKKLQFYNIRLPNQTLIQMTQ